jgi:glycosyltransferase involved in cell wall biosynthesis
MNNKSQGILQINHADIEGGAAKIAFDLFKTLDEYGYSSYFAVGIKRSDENNVIQISNDQNQGKCECFFSILSKKFKKIPGLRIFFYYINLLGKPSKLPNKIRCYLNGIDDFDYPETSNILQISPFFKPDIIHCHNFHWGYFDLRILPELNKHVPIVITHHDAWLISGFCIHSFGCTRWKTGCGRCPDLTYKSAFHRDGTIKNWKQKYEIFKQCQLYVVTPCQWLMDMVHQSMMKEGIQASKVIPNGVDLKCFYPSNQKNARIILNLPLGIKILLFVGTNMKKSPWKDYKTLLSTIKEIATSGIKVLCLILGDKSSSVFFDNVEIRFIPYTTVPQDVAHYYNATDIYVHPAFLDTFPTVILEALACGTPVVASAVGGIPEQIIEGKTGFLVPSGNSELMARRIIYLLENNEILQQMGQHAAEDAVNRFGLERMVKEYIQVYDELLHNNSRCN